MKPKFPKLLFELHKNLFESSRLSNTLIEVGMLFFPAFTLIKISKIRPACATVDPYSHLSVYLGFTMIWVGFTMIWVGFTTLGFYHDFNILVVSSPTDISTVSNQYLQIYMQVTEYLSPMICPESEMRVDCPTILGLLI